MYKRIWNVRVCQIFLYNIIFKSQLFSIGFSAVKAHTEYEFSARFLYCIYVYIPYRYVVFYWIFEIFSKQIQIYVIYI